MTFTYRVLLRPSDICFRKKLLPSSFDNGIPLRETLQQLLNDEILVEDVPTIDVVWCQEKWAWYTLNSRRLWVFRELERKGKCQHIATKRVESIQHVTDFLLYGSAELLDESPSLSCDSEDGLQITVFNKPTAGKTRTVGSHVETSKQIVSQEERRDGSSHSRRNWRERTPLTIKISWDDGESEKDNGKQSPLQADPITTDDSMKRERKDSGFSEASCGSARNVEKSRLRVCSAESSERESEDGDSTGDRKSRRHRSNRFQRYRPYSRPETSGTPSERRERCLQKRRLRQSALQSECLKRQLKGIYDRLLYILHHGDKPRKEQYQLKTMLMNTCGFCFKSFRAGVSLSQHIEELQHWACIRCGKYFRSYTALGQHKLSLDHCNV